MVNILNSNLVTLKVDCIVNAANGVGIMGHGIAGAIKNAAGIDIQTEAREICSKPYQAGSAYFTKAYGLANIKYVIHAVTMTYPGTNYSNNQTTGLYNITSSINQTLRIARSLGVKSIAFPALGTGVGRLNKTLVAQQMINILKDITDLEIIICDRDSEFTETCKELIKQ